MPTITYQGWVFWLFTILSASGAAYCGAYLKKKGENVATREDLAALVEQVKQTTEATKAIEERISLEFSHKQRLWEMKKEALHDIVACSMDIDDSLRHLGAVNTTAEKNQHAKELIDEHRTKASLALWDALKAYSKAQAHARIICSEETNKQIAECGQAFRALVAAMVSEPATSYRKDNPAAVATAQMLSAVRKDLGVD